MDENSDLDFEPENPKLHKRRLILAATVFVITGFLVLYSIYLSSRSVNYFVSIDGSNVVQQGQPIAMRFSAIGIYEQMPLSYVAVRVDLENADSGEKRNLFKKYSKGEPYIWWVGDLPSDMTAGEYRLKLRASTVYGPEDNEFGLTVTKEPQPRSVQVAELEESYLKRSTPMEIITPEGTLLLRMIPNNGKYVPSLLNDVLVSVENKDTRAAVADFKFGVWLENDLIADLVTDVAGLARFSYYPSGLTSNKLKVKTVLSDDAPFEGEFEMFPWGAQIVAEMKQHFIAAGQPLEFSLTTLRPGKWLVDVYKNGNLIMHSPVESAAAKKPVKLQLPAVSDGLLYVQIAADSDNPTHAFEAFFLYVYEKDQAAMLSALEKALRQGVAFYTPDIIDIAMLDEWGRWLKSVPDAEMSREDAAARVLSALPKRYIIMPDMMDTRESKITAFDESMLFKRNLVLTLLAICGVSVVLYLGTRIRQEILATKRLGFGMDFRPNQVLQLTLALVALSLTYIALLYLLSNLNWHMGM